MSIDLLERNGPEAGNEAASGPAPRTAAPQAAERIVVIGNGMAGFRLCERLDELGGARKFRVAVIGEEPYPAYDRVHLTDFLAHGDVRRLALAPREWYEERGIELVTGERATAIDREAKVVRTDLGGEFPYDRLALATGSVPFAPPIAGRARPGVFFYRTVADVEAIARAARGGRAAIVVGGGLLGLEAARALQAFDLKIHLIEMASFLMPRQLDAGAAQTLLEAVRAGGIDARLSTSIEAIEERDGRLAARLNGGEEIEADLVVISAGIRPRDELARASGIEIAGQGGILVDATLATSDPSIFAIGECASVRGTVFGLAGPGMRMAEVVAERLAGGNAEFREPDMSTRLKMLGVDVVSLGDGLAGGELHVYAKDGVYRRIVLERGRLIGAVGVGAWEEAARLRDQVAARAKISGRMLRRFELEGELLDSDWLGVAGWPATATVCNCRSVMRGALSCAIAAGCAEPADLSRATGAGTVCGSCQPLLAELLGAGAVSGPQTAPRRWLLGFSIAAIALAAIHWSAWPILFADSMESPWRAVDALWRDGVLKQVSGYSTLTVSLGALLLSLRKRWRRFTFGDFNKWRAAHALLGAATLAILFVHTGFRIGANLNMALAIAFLAANLSGGTAGAAAAMEPASPLARRLRPALTLIHILILWPLPLLIALHIFAVYRF